MTDAATPGPWPTSERRMLHIFDDPVSVMQNPALDRHRQTERTCKVCGAVKVTVHAPDGRAWREWRVNASSAQIACEALPCKVAT